MNDSPYERVEQSSQDRNFKLPAQIDSRNQTIISMTNVQAPALSSKALPANENTISTQSAYNDTFMPRKLQAIFPPKTSNSKERLPNSKSIKTSNS